ncbi:hypothetical protein AArcMg_1485 [Natrarchaeobaculum sulfurireducens]|uniref:Uncharacterized protein n=1 Tax=Natrarchaeobaculum sulfurireducens TaxID=2044521 RepID=A0A346PPQ3_9EURY|nr:hypothetical protein AArcMg_1485 [Natrarchaeobaculum sulfurireducens]
MTNHGETVEHEWVADASFDTDYNLDVDESEIETQQLKAVISNPSDEAFKRLEGRGSTPEYELTVPSDADVQVDREGRPDRFRVRGDYCEVAEVRHDKHPMADMEKKTVVVAGLDGR